MPKEDDPIIAAVIRLNAGYTNSDYEKRDPVRIGDSLVYIVTFKGENGFWYQNYVYQKDERLTGFQDLAALLLASEKDLHKHGLNLEFLRMSSVIAFTLLFSVAVIWLVFRQPDNKALQILTGFVGLGLGYLVGKASPVE
jgi:hypothetical protein